MANAVRLLMTACGAPGAPGIIKCLRNNGERNVFIYGVDMNPEAVGFAMVDDGQVGPPGQDPGFADFILEQARAENLQAVMPLSTMELEALSAARERFDRAGVSVLVSDLAGLRTANNKGELMEVAACCGVLVPRFIRVQTVRQFEEAVRALGFPEQPVCFKPEFGKGGRGFRILSGSRDPFEDLFEQKPGSAFTTLHDVIGILRMRASFPPLLVMEYLPGAEYSVDLLCRAGEVLAVVPRVRTAIRLGICSVGETVRDQRLIEFSSRLVRELRLSYCINLQFRMDAEGVPRLLECNPRVSGTIVLCAGAGVNLPYLALKLALKEPVLAIEPRWGIRMMRYWDEVFRDNQGHHFVLPDGLDHLQSYTRDRKHGVDTP